jgi:UDP-sugar transporter A1/2/3
MRTTLRVEATKTRSIVLVLLVMQTTAAVLLMRYSRTAVRPAGSGPPYLATVAVFMAEVFKLPFCVAMTAWSCGGPTKVWGVLRTEICEMWTDALKCAIPAVAYTLQSNLLFVALAVLDAPTYQITYQTKTIFTALFSRLLLGRKLEVSQWMALLLLTLGCILVTDLRSKKPHAKESGSRSIGLLAVGAAALLSSSSSVYFEKMLKRRAGAAQQQAGLWLRNIQLGMFALPLAAACMAYQDHEQIRDYGLLQGFDSVVWTVVLLNSCGGLLVAAVMKYADNIVKCFAAALAIVSGTLISVPLFNFHPSRLFAVGGLCTVSATVLYSWAPTQWPEGWTRAGRQQQRRRATASLELEALDAQEPLVEGGEAKLEMTPVSVSRER